MCVEGDCCGDGRSPVLLEMVVMVVGVVFNVAMDDDDEAEWDRVCSDGMLDGGSDETED